MKRSEIHFKTGLVYLVVLLSVVVENGTNQALAGEDPGDLFNYSFEVGMTFGMSKSISIWKANVDRVGIDYRWGDDGFRGIGLNMGFPF